MPKRRQRTEASIEAACCRYLKKLGLVHRKMNGFGFNAWPDRMILPPNMGAPWSKGSARGHVLWVELKRPKEDPTPLQAKLHDDLRCSGQEVAVVRTLEEFKAAVREFHEKYCPLDAGAG
jgi:hypothetical protein